MPGLFFSEKIKTVTMLSAKILLCALMLNTGQFDNSTILVWLLFCELAGPHRYNF